MAGNQERRQRTRWWRWLLHPSSEATGAVEDEEGRLEYELTMLQETARVLSSTFDLESVFAALVRTAALIVSAPRERQRRAAAPARARGRAGPARGARAENDAAARGRHTLP